MKLLLYLGEQLVDEAPVYVFGLPKLQGQMIREAMRDLLTKHKKHLAASDLPPSFFLEGVSSRINGFHSLKDQHVN